MNSLESKALTSSSPPQALTTPTACVPKSLPASTLSPHPLEGDVGEGERSLQVHPLQGFMGFESSLSDLRVKDLVDDPKSG